MRNPWPGPRENAAKSHLLRGTAFAKASDAGFLTGLVLTASVPVETRAANRLTAAAKVGIVAALLGSAVAGGYMAVEGALFCD
jgi:hypothetical protein